MRTRSLDEKQKVNLCFLSQRDFINKGWNGKRKHWGVLCILVFLLGIILGHFIKV
jgi:hypothetical protein